MDYFLDHQTDSSVSAQGYLFVIEIYDMFTCLKKKMEVVIYSSHTYYAPSNTCNKKKEKKKTIFVKR